MQHVKFFQMMKLTPSPDVRITPILPGSTTRDGGKGVVLLGKMTIQAKNVLTKLFQKIILTSGHHLQMYVSMTLLLQIWKP